ncbi:2436_t:CDS:1, partial [Gigaspora rosea]
MSSLSVSRPLALSAGFIFWFCKYNLSFARKSRISSSQQKKL